MRKLVLSALLILVPSLIPSLRAQTRSREDTLQERLKGVQSVHVIAEFTSSHLADSDKMYFDDNNGPYLEQRCRAAGLRVVDTDDAADVLLHLLIRTHFAKEYGPTWIFGIVEFRAVKRYTTGKDPNGTAVFSWLTFWRTDPNYIYANPFQYDGEIRKIVDGGIGSFISDWKQGNGR